MDILGRNNAPNPLELIEIGEGVTALRPRRPRPRRQAPARSVFDARQLFLESQAADPPQRWSLGVILYALVRDATLAGFDDSGRPERLADLDRYFDLAAARGLSPDDHLMPYLRSQVARSIMAVVFAGRAQGAEPSESVRSWVDLCAVPVDAQGKRDRHAEFRMFLRVLAWARNAERDELLSWRAPLTLPPPLVEEAEDQSDDAAIGAWIFERFTQTFIEQWSPETLRLEWRYLHGQQGAPCSSVEMRGREVPTDELAKVMAERFSRPRPRVGRGAALGDRSSAFLVDPALKFIKDGRRAEARALFEAILLQDQDSSMANNNLGFCLLPDDPEQALEYLDRAVQLGIKPLELAEANRMLALALLGRSTSLFDLAARVFDLDAASSAGEEPLLPSSLGGSFLWDPRSMLDGTYAEIIQVEDLRSYAALVVHLVHKEHK
jgi:TPR repeat protein